MADAAMAPKHDLPSSPSSRRRTCIRCGTASSASRRSSRSRRTRRSSGAGATSSRSPHRAVGEVSIDDVERRALILAHPGVRRRNRRRPAPARRLHRARSRRPRAPAPPHLRGDPLRHARRRRRHHRQRPPLRDEGRRPDPHAADVLARPHQRERSPHHLVRRRQHAADPRGSTPTSSSPAIRATTSSGRSTRATRRCGPKPACVAEGAPASAANSPKYRYPGEATRRLLAGAAAPAPTARARSATSIRRPAAP